MIIVSVSVYLLPESINNPAKRIRHTFMNNEVEMKEMSDKRRLPWSRTVIVLSWR